MPIVPVANTAIARKLGATPLLALTLNNYLLAALVPGGNAARREAAEELASLPGLPRSAELVARVSRMACLLRDGDLAEWDRELACCQRLLDQAIVADANRTCQTWFLLAVVGGSDPGTWMIGRRVPGVVQQRTAGGELPV